MSNGRRWYLAVTVLMVGAHAFVVPDLRAVLYVLAAPMTVPPIAMVLRRAEGGKARLPFFLLMVAMCVLSAANALETYGPETSGSGAETAVMLGYGLLLAAAIALVLLRGRNDIGGMLDVSVAAIAGGGVTWIAVLSPHLRAFSSPATEKLTILVCVLVLAGVLGALLRLYLSDHRRPALGWLLAALGVALIGNVTEVITTGTLVSGRGSVSEMLFMAAYACVGLAVLEPSIFTLMLPGVAPVDTLSAARLVLLGLALMAYPVAGGIQVMVGAPADGPLLTAGSLLITPLVMIRVGRLAQQRQRAEHQLRHQATHDQLTGLPNRAALLSRLGTLVDAERASRQPGVVLLFCDLNGFKPVNDRLGHEAGDLLLVEVGVRLRAGLRSGDTVARYGGDEFLLLCSAPGEQKEAAERLREHVARALATPIRLGTEDVTVGASVGVTLSDGFCDADELISTADQEMYRDKQRSKSTALDGTASSGAVKAVPSMGR